MLHIVDDLWLDCDQYCFILQEKYETPPFREVKGEQIPNKNAGEIVWMNQTFHATHQDVIDKLMDIALKKAVNGDYIGFVEMIEETKKQFRNILKVKRK